MHAEIKKFAREGTASALNVIAERKHTEMSLFGFVDRIPPRVFLFAYLLAVPTFAGLFWAFCPGGFYAPYAHLEQWWVDEGQHLGNTLIKSFAELERWPLINSNSVAGYPRNPGELNVYNVVTNDGKSVNFVVDGILQIENVNEKGSVPKRTLFYCNATIDLAPHTFTDGIYKPNSPDLGDNKLIPFQIPGTTYVDVRLDYSKICDEVILRQAFDYNGQFLNLDLGKSGYSELTDYLEGFNGNPSSVAGNYWRMLYMSAVIITTLGLGDIVPISSLSRALVGAEAFLGVMLASLFLNSLASKASRRPDP